MTPTFPSLQSDDRGVWLSESHDRRWGIEWDEIVSVGGHKLDGVTDVYTVVELDDSSGHWVELHADWYGFQEVLDGITSRLPGIPVEWFSKIDNLQVEDAPITVWRRL